MTLVLPSAVPIFPPNYMNNEIVLFDDFIGAAYDNSVWGISGATVSTLNSLNGRLRVSAGMFYFADMGIFSCEETFYCEWKGSLTVTGSNYAECGMNSSTNAFGTWMAWQRRADTATFLIQVVSNGNYTELDSGLPANANEHLFQIQGSSGVVQFFLDGVWCTTITTNVTSDRLQPYIFITSGNANMDYCLIAGGS